MTATGVFLAIGHTPNTALSEYHRLLWQGNLRGAYLCLARPCAEGTPPVRADMRAIALGVAFNRQGSRDFRRYWRRRHTSRQRGVLGRWLARFSPPPFSMETRQIAGSVEGGGVLLLAMDGGRYWLVPAVRLDERWYLCDGQLHPRMPKS